MSRLFRRFDATLFSLSILFGAGVLYAAFGASAAPPVAVNQSDLRQRLLAAEAHVERLRLELSDERQLRRRLQGELRDAAGQIEGLLGRLGATHSNVVFVPEKAAAARGKRAVIVPARFAGKVEPHRPRKMVVSATQATGVASPYAPRSRVARVQYRVRSQEKPASPDGKVTRTGRSATRPRYRVVKVETSEKPASAVARVRTPASSIVKPVPDRTAKRRVVHERRSSGHVRRRAPRYRPTYGLGRYPGSRSHRRRSRKSGFSRNFRKQLEKSGFFDYSRP